MKKSILALAVLGSFSAAAFAQSSVTIYGRIDESINYTTNQDAAGHSVTSLGDSNAPTGAADGGQGALSGSRWGFKGEEDLGGGSKALFLLESGFTANNGQSDQQGQLFGRQEYVGLANSDLGQLTFGRQYGTMTQMAFDYDPLGVGNYQANEWEIFLYGVRFDNSIEYQKKFGPVELDLQYSLGGVAGNNTQGSATGVQLKYNQAGLGLGVAFQQMSDINSNKSTVGGIGATYEFGPATLFGDYSHINTDAGFAKGSCTNPPPGGNTALGCTSAFGLTNAGNPNRRTDQLWTIGLGYKLAPSIDLTLGFMDDQISNYDISGDGSLKSAYALVEYHLSKRTEVYATVDWSKAGGQAATTAASGSGSLNGVGAGQTNSSALGLGVRLFF